MFDPEIEAAALAVLTALKTKGWRIATAESCTGGLIAGALTALAGSSEVVEGGFITYSNDAKTQSLGVPAALIAAHGAVSDEVAAAMAEGALTRLPQTDLVISVTGIAGPGGGSSTKPVGLVYFGLALRGQMTRTGHSIFPGDRTSVRQATVLEALKMALSSAR